MHIVARTTLGVWVTEYVKLWVAVNVSIVFLSVLMKNRALYEVYCIV